jgi:hypothetical protein
MAMGKSDPHREAGCQFVLGGTDWHSGVDWAVYHAPGFEAWQRFRKSLVGLRTSEKIRKLREWPTQRIEDVIRVLNYTRALRADWSDHPSLVDYSRFLDRRCKQLLSGPLPKEICNVVAPKP